MPLHVPHTPTPWVFDDTLKYHRYPVIRRNGVVIAVLSQASTMKPEVFAANAALLEAAPDLLSALSALLGDQHWLQEDRNEQHRHACIHCGREYWDNDTFPGEPDYYLPSECAVDCPGQMARDAIAKATGV